MYACSIQSQLVLRRWKLLGAGWRTSFVILLALVFKLKLLL